MRTLYHLIRADFLERTRRYSFLVILCLVIYLGYAVNTGQVFIQLDGYRGIYNSAWVGSLMALVITFFLGIFGFFLVKNTVERDERTGVGQIIATTSLTRPQYLFGKWLSNFAVLTALVSILSFAAILMQMVQREDAQIQIWALTAPFLLIALPMMALVAALAVFFETVSWLKGGFGNMVYFFLFIFIFIVGVQLTQNPGLDITGFSLVSSSTKAAAKIAFPDYDGGFVLSMADEKPLGTFVWSGLDWTAELILQRMLWFVISIGVTLSGSLFFPRFDPTSRSISKPKQKPDEITPVPEETFAHTPDLKLAQLMPLAQNRRFCFNFWRLVWLEILLLVKGLKWYWFAALAIFWVGCVLSPSEDIRKYWFMLIAIWPVLLWSKLGEREVRYQTEQLMYLAPYPVTRMLASSWLAGVLVTAVLTSGVPLGRCIHAEPVALSAWVLSVVFIPTLALTFGIWSCSSKLFEVIYPILWYLGPFNRENQLVILDYLGIHAEAPVNTSPLWFIGFMFLLIFLAAIGRKRQIQSQ